MEIMARAVDARMALPPVSQVGIVVKDIEKVASLYVYGKAVYLFI